MLAGFRALLKQEMPALDRDFVDHLFDGFDDDGSGSVDQQEFILGLATLTGDDPQQVGSSFHFSLWPSLM